MDAGVYVEALVHGGVGDARGRLGKLVLGALAGVLRRLESAPLPSREGHGLARAVRRRLVRGVRLAEEAAARARRSAARRRSMDAGAVTTARTVMRPAHPEHARDVHVEGSAQEGGLAQSTRKAARCA